MCILSLLLLFTYHISILASDDWALYSNRAVNFFKGSDAPPQSCGNDQVNPASILLEVWALQSNWPPSNPLLVVPFQVCVRRLTYTATTHGNTLNIPFLGPAHAHAEVAAHVNALRYMSVHCMGRRLGLNSR